MVLTFNEAEEILEHLELQLEGNMELISIKNEINFKEIEETSKILEEYGDVLDSIKIYSPLTHSLYELAGFIRTKKEKIVDKRDFFLNHIKSLSITLKNLRFALFNYEDINKNGFYNSFRNDCVMFKEMILDRFVKHQTMDDIFF